MKEQYTATQLRRRIFLWASAKDVSLIVFGGMWAMFLTSRDGIVMAVWALLAFAALMFSVWSANRWDKWTKRRVAGW